MCPETQDITYICDEGIKGMFPGGIRQLGIPPELAVGEQEAQTILPNATVIFEIGYRGRRLVDLGG